MINEAEIRWTAMRKFTDSLIHEVSCDDSFGAGWDAARLHYEQPSWREQAYARLGAIRDRMKSSDVVGVQNFLADTE